MSLAFDPHRFRALVAEHRLVLGQPLEYRSVTGSTNDDALSAARAGAAHGTCFVADMQQRGRGRRGHTWTAPAGTSLLCSVILRPRVPVEAVAALTLVVGLSVRASVACRVPPAVGIKWPNDIVVGDQKLAGVLLEASVREGRAQAVVAGVGVNLTQLEFEEPLRSRATSLALLGGQNTGRERLLVDLLVELSARLARYEAEGFGALLPEIVTHDTLCGRRIRIAGAMRRAQGIDGDGALLVEDETGGLERITSGSVELP